MAEFAERLEGISAFKAMEVLSRANELQEMGRDVIHLEVGEPDFATPAPIVAAAKQALDAGETKYTSANGIPSLREAISRHYESNYDVDVDPRRVFVTAGGSGALLLATALLINPGDGMLMTDPGYPCNRHFVRSFNGDAQLVPVSAEEQYQLSARTVRQFWQTNTRAVLLASPANPTGSLLTTESLAGIAEIAAARNGHMVVDEIYHGLHYGESRIATGLQHDGIVLNSFSKYFGMTGWRLGWLVVPEAAVQMVEKLAQNLFICPSSISQHAALAAFSDEAKTIMEEQRSAFKDRRDLLVKGLRELGFGVPETPGGAFYVYAKLPQKVSLSSEAFCSMLLEQHNVAITPGTDFGTFQADRHVRFSYANDLLALNKALAALAEALR